ncbi:uncharacterized protein LOC108744795 [Agrilus planipennis]|uniref:Uncharacterized protein LOC108744795 n=1 Tax=Agrilus planipennis TaxID=224129 RepID=A0A1W4XUV8_AGRPL|nr:uncharacterized protein LOC108744795 [Agrilus planipennis]
MRQFRIFHKRLILWVIFCFQVSLLLAYLFLNVDIISATSRTSKRVSFFTNNSFKYVPLKKNTYHTYKHRIYLKKQSSNSEFIDFNTSICFRNGTDIKLMLHKQNNDKWNCKCLPTFHGNNCGQPEIIWRALLNFRKSIKIKGPRKYKRNILFVVIVDKFLTTALEIMISELNSVVDLFILIEYSGEVFLKNQLNNGFLRQYHKEVLYLNIVNENDLFSKIQNSIGNLKQETLIAFINEK